MVKSIGGRWAVRFSEGLLLEFLYCSSSPMADSQISLYTRWRCTPQLRTMDNDQSPTYLSQCKLTSENRQWSYTHIIWTLVGRFRNATVALFKDRPLLLIMLAFLVNVSNREVRQSAAFNRPANHSFLRLPEVYQCLQWTLPYSGPAVMVLYLSIILIIVEFLLPSCYWKWNIKMKQNRL